jgi:hypothetical protein
MSKPPETRVAGPVRLDHGTLRGQAAGSDTVYTIALRGLTDDRWVEAYRTVQQESLPHRRFRLDRQVATISFSCPAVEGPMLVLEMLDRAESFLALVEARVEAWRSGAVANSPQAAFHSFL